MSDSRLYNEDYYAWTLAQARNLRELARARVNTPLDLNNLAEEVEDLGKSERDAVRSHVTRIIEHLLKLEHSPTAEPRFDWMSSIAESRGTLDDKLTKSLRRDVEDNLDRLYERAREQADLGLRKYGEDAAAAALPRSCPYTFDQIVQSGWYPADRSQEPETKFAATPVAEPLRLDPGLMSAERKAIISKIPAEELPARHAATLLALQGVERRLAAGEKKTPEMSRALLELTAGKTALETTMREKGMIFQQLEAPAKPRSKSRDQGWGL